MDSHVSREALRNPVRFELDSVHTYVCRRVVRTMERGLSGQIDKDQAPGYAVGLKAALALLDRTAPVPRAGNEPQRPTAINIAIISSDAAGHASQAHGVAVRFVGGNGYGA